MMDLRVGHLDKRIRSKGCLRCIRSKLKCDETKPSCRRCLQARRQCPGYRIPRTTFVIETGYAGPRLITAAPLSPRKPPVTDWTQNAVCHYMYHFVINPQDELPGMHEGLPQLYLRHPEKNHLQSAVQAVAMANLARVQKMSQDFTYQAQHSYYAAIRGLRLALNDGIERTSSTSLMTAEILAEYDLIAWHLTSPESPMPSPHLRGMVQILGHRHASGSEDSLTVTQGAFTYVLLQSLCSTNASLNIPPSFDSYPKNIPTAARSILCNLLTLMHQTTSVRLDLRLAAEHKKTKLEADLWQLNRELKQWESTVLEAWRYTIYPNRVRRVQQSTFPLMALVFPNYHSMMLWNTYWITRLGALICLDGLHPATVANSDIHSDMSLLAENICCAVPYMTGQWEGFGDSRLRESTKILGAVFALRSLLVAREVSNLSEDKKLWISRQLEYMAFYKGVG